MLMAVHRVLLILMIAVLPLRALAADWMWVNMSSMTAVHGGAAAMPDCDTHAAPASERDDRGAPLSPGADPQCGSCALCFPVAQSATFDHAMPFDLPEARPAAGDDDFVSAFSARNFRPPAY